MNIATERIIKAATAADSSIDPKAVLTALGILRGKSPTPNSLQAAVLLVNQATAAKVISGSRFLIRRLVKDGKLRQIHLTPDCVRYSSAELEKLAAV